MKRVGINFKILLYGASMHISSIVCVFAFTAVFEF